MAGTAVLDPIDRLILRALQEDGRTTNVALSEKVGLTAPPCLRRVRSLEESGIIRGYHARLDPERLGYGITVFAMVSLKSQAEADLRAFEEHVNALPEVRECHMLNGEIDFRSEEHTSELQSLMRISYDVLRLKNNNNKNQHRNQLD